MIPHVDDCYFYKRIDSTLIAVKSTGEEIPVVKFKKKFIDLQVVDQTPLEYMKKYMEMFPHLIEIIEPKSSNEQLTLF